MYWGGEKGFRKRSRYLDFLTISLPYFLSYAKVWLLKNNLSLFELNDKLLIHTVRTHVINYDCVFFVQNSCWENRVSSDCLREAGYQSKVLTNSLSSNSWSLGFENKGLQRVEYRGEKLLILDQDGHWQMLTNVHFKNTCLTLNAFWVQSRFWSAGYLISSQAQFWVGWLLHSPSHPSLPRPLFFSFLLFPLW